MRHLLHLGVLHLRIWLLLLRLLLRLVLTLLPLLSLLLRLLSMSCLAILSRLAVAEEL